MPHSKPAFIHRRSVEFHETDAAGLAHFSNLFRWMEAAELAFLAENGAVAFSSSRTNEYGWPRASACAQFKAPLRYGDLVETHVRVLAVGKSCVRYGLEIWRLSGDGAPELSATGELACVYVKRLRKNSAIRPAPLPATLRAKLKKFLP